VTVPGGSTNRDTLKVAKWGEFGKPDYGSLWMLCLESATLLES